MPFNVVLVEPEIPQNTGNIIRLCANTGATLHLVEPLAFDMTEKSLRRASLDYSHLTDVVIHKSVDDIFETLDLDRTFATTVGGNKTYNEVEYQPDDTIIFGSESRGLPDAVLSAIAPDNRLSIPMMPSNRSINLSNAVPLVVYEMWRQQSFVGGELSKQSSRPYFS